MHLKDKVVFITGAAGGIGAACAKAVVEKGAKVIVADISDENGQILAESLNSDFGKGRAIFVKLDVSEAVRFEEAFSTAVAAFGQVDVMVNNAGILDESQWEKTLDINLKGTIIGTEIALAHMRKDKGGHGGVIVNVASVSGFRPAHFMPVYVSSKHGQIGFTRSMAAVPDINAQGVRYACICPEVVDTPIIDDVEGRCRAGYFDVQMTLVTKKRLSPSTVAEGLLSLVADDDSNGALLHVSLEGLARIKPTVI